ncbi:hypothetical protein Tco_0169110 [Tanacetum coccineum]
MNEVIPKDETHELVKEFQYVDKYVPTIVGHERMEATLRDMMSNQFKDVEEYAYHLEQSKNYMENQIYDNSEDMKYVLSLHKIHDVPFPEEDLEEKMNHWVRKYFKTFNEEARVTIEQQHMLDYMEQIIVMRENDKPDSFSEADFKYLNKNDIEDIYYLCLNKKVNYRENKLLNSLMTFIRSRVIWERVHDFQLGIESYQIKINLTAPMLIFPEFGEIIKFCDDTLERVLKELKLKIFETEFLKKAPLLGELDLDIMKAYEREITKRLRYHEQMRRWESFMIGRPILLMMRRHNGAPIIPGHVTNSLAITALDSTRPGMVQLALVSHGQTPSISFLVI